MTPCTWRFDDVGDSGLLISQAVETVDGGEVLRGLTGHLRHIELTGVFDYVPASTSLLVCYDPLVTTRDTLIEQVRRFNTVERAQTPETRVITISVEYGGIAGPDLDAVAEATGLRPYEVIGLHTATTFPVEMIGFMPGFPYIGGLPAVLHLPRRSVPRVVVPAGSVAIANGRTGIYPTAAPGGWHLIGRTSTQLFDPQREPPALLAPGDYVQFIAASTSSF